VEAGVPEAVCIEGDCYTVRRVPVNSRRFVLDKPDGSHYDYLYIKKAGKKRSTARELAERIVRRLKGSLRECAGR
jgi:hypothetical protein